MLVSTVCNWNEANLKPAKTFITSVWIKRLTVRSTGACRQVLVEVPKFEGFKDF